MTRPKETLRDHVVTPQLARCFDDALAFICSALDARSSKASYLHGSFGAGKSHFMDRDGLGDLESARRVLPEPVRWITGPSGPVRQMGQTWARPTRSSTPARCEFAGRGGRIETVLPAHSVQLLRFEVA